MTNTPPRMPTSIGNPNSDWMPERPGIPHTYTVSLEFMQTCQRHTAILSALLEALECRDIEGMMRADPELVRAVGAEIARAAKVGRTFVAG